MSRLSDYSDQHILDIIHAAGYVRLSGQHSNGQSVHELIHSCGMVNLKNSKTLLSDKRHCGFIPCHPRGKLSLLYLKTIATRLGLDDVTHDQEGQTELRRLTISANDLLRWTKGDAVMTQSWHTVRSRALSCKKAPFSNPTQPAESPAPLNSRRRPSLYVARQNASRSLPACLPVEPTRSSTRILPAAALLPSGSSNFSSGARPDVHTVILSRKPLWTRSRLSCSILK
jgi:hypothetical protein